MQTLIDGEEDCQGCGSASVDDLHGGRGASRLMAIDGMIIAYHSQV